MTVTSVELGSLELMEPGTYGVAQDTYFALRSGVPRTARMVEMAGRYPAYVGSTPSSRPIPLLVFLHATTAVQRMIDYDVLIAEIEGYSYLIPLQWTEDGATQRYWCHVNSVHPSDWMTRVAIDLLAPNPNAEVVP